MITARPYQREAVDAVFRELVERALPSTILVLATGLGKTIIASLICERWTREGRGRVLLCAHREELLTQAEDKIRRSTGISTGIEQAESFVDRSRLPAVTIASVQSMRGSRLRSFPRDAFSLVIRDEAHHAAADSDRAIAEHFGGARLLGLTATPTRTDGQALSLIFRSVAYEYRIRQAIRDRWLAPIRRSIVQIPGLDLSRVRGAADFTDADLEQAMDGDVQVGAVARAILDGTGRRRTMVFGPGVRYIRRLCTEINRLAGQPIALAIDGTASDVERAATLDAYRTGRARILGNVALYTEGFDEPTTEAIVVARPTKSDGLFTQIVGRGLRLSEGKRDCLVLEITGRTASTQKVISTLDILGYDESPTVRRRAAQLLDRDPALDCCAALDRAHAEGERVVASGGRPAARIDRSGKDGLAFALELDGLVLLPPTVGAEPANGMQRAELARAGIDRPGLDVRQAQHLLEGLRWRVARRLTSPKQAAVLRRYGYAVDVSAREAGRIMAQLAANKWQPLPRQAALRGV